MTILTIIILAACLVAAATDLTTRRIPNWLTAALAVFALATHAAGGWNSLGVSLAILFSVTVLGLFAFNRRWLGGGDVKLLAAGAAAFGWPDCIAFLVYTSLAGGVISLIVLLRRRQAWAALCEGFVALHGVRHGAIGSPAPAKGIMLPYAFAIASGASFVALSQSVAPILRLSL